MKLAYPCGTQVQADDVVRHRVVRPDDQDMKVLSLFPKSGRCFVAQALANPDPSRLMVRTSSILVSDLTFVRRGP